MRAFALLLLTLAALAFPAAAQDIPGRVGRLAWVDGNVALYQDPYHGWEDAYLNSPITSRNSVWTDPDARAAVQVAAIAVRMDGASQLDVSRIDDDRLEATLVRGTVAVRIHHLRPTDQVRLSTPQASFVLRAQGRYRLDSDPEGGESRLSVFEGAARMESANGSVRVRAGESVVVWGEDRPAYAFQAAYLTDFDRWAMARDERWVERRAPVYVSYEMTGYEDLDEYGEWSRDDVYGVVWYPTRVADDWAPYRYGRWAYVEPWGWTWVDAQPWGYAPFHYGRWVYLHDRWAWYPGRRVDRPVWAPALVGFIGGAGWSVSESVGGPVVGWYPLAPSEPYRPWYRASRQYEQRVNITVVNVNVPKRIEREHREWNRDRAATVVRRQALIEQQPIARARVSVSPQVVRSAPVIAAPANALPTRNEVREARRREHPQGRAQAGPPAGPATQGNASPLARRNGGTPSQPANPAARPNFARPSVAPHAAPKNATPPPPASASQPGMPAPASNEHGAARPPSQPAARPDERQRERGNAQRERPNGARNAEDQHGPRAREAEQNRANARPEAEQERARAGSDARGQAARVEQERARAENEARQQRAGTERESRQAAEAQRKAAEQEARGRAAQEQQHKAQEAQQRKAQEAQQRAADEARRRAGQEQAQARAQQERQRAAKEAQRRPAQPEPPHGQEGAAQEKGHGTPAQRGRPDEADKEKGRGEGG